MKPAAVVRQGRCFVTRRATTDEPREIQGELHAQGITHVFKGDQNQAWDAVLANHCLARAVADQGAEITFFVQDEKLGTPDVRLIRYWRRRGARYALTEDYYRSRSGAVWEHQDASYGLFYTEPISPEQFTAAAVHLPRTADLWARYGPQARQDAGFVRALASLGVALAGESPDAATRLGPSVDPEALAACFTDYPDAELFYALTKSDGLYGIIPTDNEDVTLSSIPARHVALREQARRLLVQVAVRGALRTAATPRLRREVIARARRLTAWADSFLEANPAATIADFQAALGQYLTSETFPQDRLRLTRTSEMTRVPSGVSPRSEENLHSFLDLALRAPAEFAAAYNEALIRVGFGLQRIKWDAAGQRYTLPFFVEYAPEGPGTSVYRYAMEIHGPDARTVVLTNPTGGSLALQASEPVRSAAALFRTLRSQLRTDGTLAVVGKAAPFMAELRRWPRALGLPRQGSRYAPMVDYLLDGLRTRGVLCHTDGLVIRIGLNALDRLDGLANVHLRLPRFLEGVLGREVSAAKLAHSWRRVAAEAQALLSLLRQCEFGQHVHLVKLFLLNYRGGNWDATLAADPRLARVAARLDAVAADPGLLRRLGRDFPSPAAMFVERALAERDVLLAERRRQRQATPPEVVEDLRLVNLRLLLIYAAYVRRLWQRADSLQYLNDRPYSLALYLLFGPEFFHHLCRRVEFDLEYTTKPSPDSCGCACGAG
ncbi:MAG: hypothetical protein HY320_06465 [Armatimonadetes bacterium]|nr:hypothetical protein [Armatimonadota bacterium]